jgi:hypothetical protein
MPHQFPSSWLNRANTIRWKVQITKRRSVIFRVFFSHFIYPRPKHLPQDFVHNPSPNLYSFLIASDPNKRTRKSIAWLGRAIAQAVSCWLATAAARVRARVCSSGIYDGQSGSGAGFLRILRFPLPIFIPPNSPSSSQLPGAGTIGHSVADVPRGPSMDSTAHYANKKNAWLGAFKST